MTPPRSDPFVDPDPARARTLPASAFTDPGFLAREVESVFHGSWLLLPDRPAREFREDPRSLADLVRTRGSRAPVTLLDRPLFLQRDWEGALHLFPNVCTHAWHTLVPGPGRERAIQCPQHGRRFDCAGRFLDQPGFEDVPDFPSADDHLRDFPVAGWGPFLFASLGEPTRPLADALAPVRESLGTLDLGALRRQPHAAEEREVAGNWKLYAWNYLDSFHIPFVHKRPGGLADAVDLAAYRSELHDDAVLQWAFAKDTAHGFDPALLPERFRDEHRRVFALWWFVWPNLTLNFYPWGLSVNQYNPVPGKPERTLFRWWHYAWDEDAYARREESTMLASVDDEDVDALSQVARGARSGFAPRGRFAPGKEDAPHWFHRRVGQAVSPPAP